MSPSTSWGKNPTNGPIPSAPSRSHTAGLGCLMLFATPFALGGAIGIGAAGRAALRGAWNDFWGLALFGLLFGGVGFGLGFGAIYGKRAAERVERARAAYPGQPWRWEDKWSRGRIRGEGLNQARGLLAFALFWNAVCLPGLIAGFAEIRQEAAWVQAAATLFPVIGVGLAIAALKSYARYRRFGPTWFQMSALPAPVGHRLEGHIDAGFLSQPGDDSSVQLRLVCVRRQRTGSGKNARTSETVLWEDVAEVDANSLAPSGGRTRIPVSFAIPSDAEPSEIHENRSTIHWRLHVEAKRPALDLKTYFEVPVYRTEASDAPISPSSSEIDAQPAEARAATSSRIRVERTGDRIEIHFPAARNVKFLVGLAAFSAIWTGICVVLLRSDAPLIFPIVFILFDTLLCVSLFFMLTLSRTVVINGGELEVTESVLGFRRSHWLVSEEVDGLEIKQGMRSGETLYYDLWLNRKTQRALKLGGGIADKREARLLLQQVKAGLGLE